MGLHKAGCRRRYALTAARELHAGFLAYSFPGGSTQSPMTLAVIDTARFANFKAAMDEFAGELRTLIAAGNDKQLVHEQSIPLRIGM